jgi:cytochrome c oxidase assembly protein subunit 15
MAEFGHGTGARGGTVHRWAVAAVVLTFLLLIAGGLVTSRDAGLAVPDWPLSYGTLNPPRWYAIENVRTEHGHRLIAGFVALFTLVVGVQVLRHDARPAARRLAVAAAGAVLLQAGLGGLRVLHLSLDLAMVHAYIAQMFFCLVVALATITSPRWPSAAPYRRVAPVPRGFRAAALATITLVLAQLVLGILLRHLGPAVRPLLQSAVFWGHLTVAAGVCASTIVLWRLAEADPAGELARRVRLLLTLVAVQIVLGFGTFFVTDVVAAGRTATVLESWLPTLHVAIGAAVLASSTAIALHAQARASSQHRLEVSVRVAEAR